MVSRILHDDGTFYIVERLGTGRFSDRFRVSHNLSHFQAIVHTNGVQKAIVKAREQYAQFLNLNVKKKQ